MNIKREIIKLCDDMIALWDGLSREIEAIPSGNEADIICRWQDYFPEHANLVGTLTATKRSVEEVKMKLIMKGELKYE